MKNSRELLLKCICQFPAKVSFRAHKEIIVTNGNLSQRKRSQADEEQQYTNPVIKDIKMGEQFTIAVSFKGYVYTWGMNDKGQLGIGNEAPTFEPIQLPQIGPTSKF